MTAEEEFTPAVERAAELLIREAETTGLIRDDVRNGLAVALDVEEMAHALFSEEQCDKRQALDVPAQWEARLNEHDQEEYRALARAIRAMILGGAS